MSWRNHLNHNQLLEGAGGQHILQISCSKSHVELLNSMLENAIATYNHAAKIQICKNKQTSFVLTESGEEGLTDEQIGDVSSEDVDAAKENISETANALIDARRENFKTEVLTIAQKHTASLELADVVITEVSKNECVYPVTMIASSKILDGTIIDEVCRIIYESTKFSDLNTPIEFSTKSELLNTIDTAISTGVITEFASSEELLNYIELVKSTLLEIPEILQKLEDRMEESIDAYNTTVLPYIVDGEEIKPEYSKIKAVLVDVIGLLLTDCVGVLVNNCGNTLIEIMHSINSIIAEPSIIPDQEYDYSDDSDSDITNESAVMGTAVAQLLSVFVFTAISSKILGKHVKSVVNQKISYESLFETLRTAIKLYETRIGVIQKELPRINKAYSAIWTNAEDIIEIMKRNQVIGYEDFVLGKFDMSIIMQIIGNMTLVEIDSIVKQLTINATIPMKLKNAVYSVYVTTVLIDNNGRELTPEAFNDGMRMRSYGDYTTPIIDPTGAQLVYRLSFDECEAIYNSEVSSSPNITDRMKKLALTQNALAINGATLTLNETVNLSEAVYEGGINRRLQRVKNLFKHGSLSLRARTKFTEEELSFELTNAASYLAKEAQSLGLVLEPKMEILEPGLYNLGWIDMDSVRGDANKIASKLKYKLYQLEAKSEILRFAIDYVIDTDATWLDVYASYSDKVIILSESADICEDDINEDTIYDNPLEDEDDDKISIDLDDDGVDDIVIDLDDDDDDDESYVNPLD